MCGKAGDVTQYSSGLDHCTDNWGIHVYIYIRVYIYIYVYI